MGQGQGFPEAIELLDRSIDLSPNFDRALANAAICRTCRLVGTFET